MALTWFLAGLGAGYLISSRQAEPGAWAGYADELQATYNLSGLRRSALDQLLDNHAREVAESGIDIPPRPEKLWSLSYGLSFPRSRRP